jgi:hypothetical protein
MKNLCKTIIVATLAVGFLRAEAAVLTSLTKGGLDGLSPRLAFEAALAPAPQAG